MVGAALAPAAGAFDVEAFVVEGTATPLEHFGVSDVPPFGATLTWDGVHTFTLELRDPVLATPVIEDTIAGLVTFTGDHLFPCEIHHGFDGKSDLAPEAYLLLAGFVSESTCGAGTHVEVVGVYLGVFLLELEN